jgi:hypothetical protein
LVALLVVSGCSVAQPKGKSPLVPACMSPDSVVLEVFFVRFPSGDQEVNGQLWQEIDEQSFPAELRRRLGRNGLRAGVVGGPIPACLARLLEIEDKPPPSGGPNQLDVAEMDLEPRTQRRHMQIRAGRRGEIVASRVYEKLSVLLPEADRLCGETYSGAEARIVVKAFPQRDGRVRLELMPELQYGPAQMRPVADDQGMFRLAASRSRREFDDMCISAVLSPGSMAVLGSLPDCPGRLGQYFFTEDDGRPQQKLLVVRLAQTQHDEMFASPEVLRLEE